MSMVPLPASSPHGAFDARLEQALDALGSSSGPGARPWTVRFATDPPRFVFENPSSTSRFSTLEAELPLRGWPHIDRALGTLPAAALFALRELLRRPTDTAHQAFADWLNQPSWAHFFSLWDQKLARLPKASANAEGIRLVLELTVERDAVAFHFLLQRPRKGGGWTPGSRPSGYAGNQIRTYADEADRRVIDALALAGRDLGFDYRFDSTQSRGHHLPRLLHALVGHPRVRLQGKFMVVKPSPACVQFLREGSGLRVAVRLGGTPRALTDVGLVLHEGVVLFQGNDSNVLEFGTLGEPSCALLQAFQTRPTSLPEESWPSLIRRIESLGNALPLVLPPELEATPVEATVQLVVQLRLDAAYALQVQIKAHVPGVLDGIVPGEGDDRIYVNVQGRRRVLERDLAEERRLVEHLVETLHLAPHRLEDDATGRCFVVSEPSAIVAMVGRVEALGDAVQLQWSSEPVRVHGAVGLRNLRVRLRSQGELLALGGEVRVDGKAVALVDIVAALRHHARYVNVSSGGFARIADDLREKLVPLLTSRTLPEDDLGVEPMALPFVDALVEGCAEATVETDVRSRLERFRNTASTAVSVPEPWHTILREYQKEGLGWLVRLSAWSTGAILADDMGLGKTLQALALLEMRGALGPALVVAPTSVVPNWVAEMASFGSRLRVVEDATLDTGSSRSLALGNLQPGDVLLLSWDKAVRDGAALASVNFATIVFDEAQAAKNASTRRATMARRLRGEFRVALSGTPIENRLGELWSLFAMTVPGLLGTQEQFRNAFAATLDRDPENEKRHTLSKMVRPFVLRRTKEMVERELPPLTESTIWVELSSEERILYEAARREALRVLGGRGHLGKDHMLFLAWLTRLRQLACHPRLVLEETSAPSSKLRAILETIETLRAEGHRMLVFSQFTEHLALVREQLDALGVAYRYLDGATPAVERQKQVEAFQRGEGELFLLSLKAGGVGINLTGASHVLHLDPWWNPAAEDQATDRAHRIGQGKPVTALRFVARATVEEAIVRVRERKRQLADAVLEGTEGAASLSIADMVKLLEEGWSFSATEPPVTPIPEPLESSLAWTTDELKGSAESP